MRSEQARQAKRIRDRDRMRVKRIGKHIPRADYIANALSTTRPWESEGISRRTWYRRQRSARP